MAAVDLAATTAFLEGESIEAAANGDGHRAWVIRDALTKLEPRRRRADPDPPRRDPPPRRRPVDLPCGRDREPLRGGPARPADAGATARMTLTDRYPAYDTNERSLGEPDP